MKPLHCLPLTLLATFLLTSCCFTPHDIGYRTDIDCRIDHILQKYRDDACEMQQDKDCYEKELIAIDILEEPGSHWWDSEILEPMSNCLEPRQFTLDELLYRAICHSPQIKVFADLPLIRKAGIKKAEAVFDPTFFLEAKFERLNRPVGSSLETETGEDRLKEVEYIVETGFRKKFVTGGTAEIKQRWSRKDSTSSFFTPKPQGTAELSLRITQPLLEGAGVPYNTTGMKIARIDTEIAQQEFVRQTEAHLLEVARTYWTLYQARAMYQIQDRLVKRTTNVLHELESRANLDAQSSQILRAKASLAIRRADLIRQESAIKNTQDRLKTLVGDPEFSIYADNEFIPIDIPFYMGAQVDMLTAACTALQHRSEVDQGFKQFHSAIFREKLAEHDLLPKLNLFLEGKLSGLTANDPYYFNSWNNQFTEGAPGYSGGLLFEYNIFNENAEADYARLRLEGRQQMHTLITTIETVLLEVKVAVREAETSLKDLIAKYEAMVAAREDLRTLMARRSISVGSELETTSYLEFLLQSQERLANAEKEFVSSLTVHNISIFNLERAQGTLLEYKEIGYVASGDTTFDDANPLPSVDLGRYFSATK